MFRDCALVYLEPGLAPTTTTSVFLLTDPVTLPPKDSISVLASSRVVCSSDQVKTKVFPVNSVSSLISVPKYFIFIPWSFNP